MKKRALILLHEGFEEIEAVTPTDLLSRVGVEITLASVTGTGRHTGRSGIEIANLLPLDAVVGEKYDLIVLPGGPGIQKIRNHTTLCELLKQQILSGGLIGCICAAPLLLLDAGLIDQSTQYTAHPSTIEELSSALAEPVVIHQQLITSTGAGTATEFALELVRQLAGEAPVKEVAEAIAWSHPF